MNNDLSISFKENSVPKLVLSNAIPAILAMIMVLVYNMADMFFIGQADDALQVAAVSLATPVFMVFMALSSVFGVGGTSLIARSLGAGKPELAKKISSFCFWCASVLGILLAAGIILFAEPLALLLGASSATLPLVVDYLGILALGAPFVLISAAFSNIVRAEGKPKIAMLGMVIGNSINIALDPLFILGLDLGIVGAAIATVIGNLAAAGFYIAYLLKGQSMLSISPKDFGCEHYIVQNIISIGVPASLASILMSASTIIVNSLMAGYGDLAVAGIGVAMKVTMITSFACIGFGQGIQPVLGFAYGAGDFARFKAIMRFSLIFSLALGSSLTVLCYLGLEQIISAFLTDAAAYQYALDFSRILLISSFIFGALFVFVNAMQAIGAATASLILNISRQGLFFIPLVLILNNSFGIEGLLYAQPLADTLTFSMAIILYLKDGRKLLKSKDPLLGGLQAISH